ncbi:hypothetical protein Taro_056822 [Colocasia esculenta]|uniref:Uncharacterized protein n=1 Tax=Colocasia esculenta TaxID=4460 RepID=A0A843XYK4_COLES|nr:hypothetical protein [Colocasia esculenta]
MQIFIRPGVGTTREAAIQNRHFDPVGRWFRGIPFRGQNPPRSVCTSTPTTVRSGRTKIFIRPGVGTAREAPIQNRDFDPVVVTPSITRIAGGSHTRSLPVTAIGSRVQLDARSPPQVGEATGSRAELDGSCALVIWVSWGMAQLQKLCTAMAPELCRGCVSSQMVSRLCRWRLELLASRTRPRRLG